MKVSFKCYVSDLKQILTVAQVMYKDLSSTAILKMFSVNYKKTINER